MDHPKKSLGQHWLEDAKALNQIVDLAELKPGETVLEVGPGLGALTNVLLERGVKLIAIEIDEELAEALKRSGHNNLTVIEEDIRHYDLSVLPKDYKLVANIPYYLTSFLLRILFDSENPPLRIVMLVQKEVAERIAAEPGKMSILSASARAFGDIKLGSEIKAELFTPPPKVDSRVISIVRRQKPLDVDRKQLFRVVKAGFSSRRKKLVNNLSAGLNIDKQVAAAQIENMGIGANARAQELSIEEWVELSRRLESYL